MVLIGVNLTDSQSDDDDESLAVPQTRTVRSKSMGAAPPHLFASDVNERGESILDGLVWSSEDDDDDDDDVRDGDGRSRRHAVDVDDLSFSTAATSSNERANSGGDAVRRDRYKFELDPRFLKFELLYLERKLKLERKAPANKKEQKMWTKSGGAMPLKKEVVRAGIPPTHRRLVWLRATRASELILHAAQSNDTYAAMMKRAQSMRDPSTLSLPVQADVHRMFPGHPILDAPAGVAKLRRVLSTYFARNSSTAYCAALPIIVAVLMLFVAEEESFFMLTMLVEQILPSQYYNANMCDIRVDCRVLSALVQERLPKLALHIAKTGAQQLVESVFVQWLLCLFVVGMPTETTLRIWDCLLCGEGNPVLLRMSIALLKLNEAELLATDDPESLMLLLYDLPKRCFDVEQLFDIAFKRIGKFALAKVNDMRAQQKPGVMLELRQAMDHRRELELAARAAVASQQQHATPTRASHSPARSPSSANLLAVDGGSGGGGGSSAAAVAAAASGGGGSTSPLVKPSTLTSELAILAASVGVASDGDDGTDNVGNSIGNGAAVVAAAPLSPTSPKHAVNLAGDRVSPPKEERRPSGSPIVRGKRSSIDDASGDNAHPRVLLLNSAGGSELRNGAENVDPQVDSRDESEKTVGNDVAEATSLASSLSSSSSLVSRGGDDNATTDEAEAVEDEEAEESMRRHADPRPLVRNALSSRRRRHRDSMRGQSGTQSESEDSTSSVTLVQSQSRHTRGALTKTGRTSNWRRSPHREAQQQQPKS
jgi:hypothetical protein